ncbi:MAG: TIGR01212 family radical SAM protein, partial [Candidatus Aegiribacteria sp.]|nr:TIGR01212 family radical SAM protein [Candidatus Aegiribacteria sp.]
RNLNSFLRHVFGKKTYKVGLWGGFTCPNRDGTFSSEGCTFCNPLSSHPKSFEEGKSITQQLNDGCRYITWRFNVSSFLPYVQDYTTTYGDPSMLDALYSEALSYPGVVGLSLCTRPDCLPEPVLGYLENLSRQTFLWVEVGVQTSDDRILKDMNRCHTSLDTMNSFRALHARKIFSAAHMIIGYPGSSRETVLADAAFIRKTGTDGVKLQNLHVVKNTSIADRFAAGEFELMTMEEYTDMVILFLEHTEPGVVILRLTGEAPDKLTVAPQWSLHKMIVLNRIHGEMKRRDTWQGKALGFCKSSVEKPLKSIRNHWRPD